MRHTSGIRCVFLDIGGVLLTNGWDRHARARAVERFGLDAAEMEDRHHINVDVYEQGKLSLHDYLNRVVFYQDRSFTASAFRNFMFEQSQPYSETLELFTLLKLRHRLKIAVVSNEAREVNAYRIKEFRLNTFVDFFICSALVHIRKPDLDIFRLALDVAQIPPEEIVYIDNSPLFVQIAEGLGIRSLLHTDCASTRTKLAEFGLDTELQPEFAVTAH